MPRISCALQFLNFFVTFAKVRCWRLFSLCLSKLHAGQLEKSWTNFDVMSTSVSGMTSTSYVVIRIFNVIVIGYHYGIRAIQPILLMPQ